MRNPDVAYECSNRCADSPNFISLVRTYAYAYATIFSNRHYNTKLWYKYLVIECDFLKEGSLKLLQKNECHCLQDQKNLSDYSENRTVAVYSTSKNQVSFRCITFYAIT